MKVRQILYELHLLTFIHMNQNQEMAARYQNSTNIRINWNFQKLKYYTDKNQAKKRVFDLLATWLNQIINRIEDLQVESHFI